MNSFKYAFEGLYTTLKTQKNYKIQIGLGILAVLLGLILKLSLLEWLVLIITINLVLILELINTSLESIVDLVSPEIHPKAKIAKDVAAAAVLISSITSILIGTFIFLPKIIR
jgi:diacylglycerol kinase